jgi:hypothetical protein
VQHDGGGGFGDDDGVKEEKLGMNRSLSCNQQRRLKTEE